VLRHISVSVHEPWTRVFKNYTRGVYGPELSLSALQGGPKKLHTKLMAIILSNFNWFLIFFHWKIPWQICSKLVIKDPTTDLICCHTTLWNINVRKQATNDRLQGSVAKYLRNYGISITKLWKVYCWVCQQLFKSVNIIQSYMQEGGCLVHLAPGHLTAKRWRIHQISWRWREAAVLTVVTSLLTLPG